MHGAATRQYLGELNIAVTAPEVGGANAEPKSQPRRDSITHEGYMPPLLARWDRAQPVSEKAGRRTPGVLVKDRV